MSDLKRQNREQNREKDAKYINDMNEKGLAQFVKSPESSAVSNIGAGLGSMLGNSVKIMSDIKRQNREKNAKYVNDMNDKYFAQYAKSHDNHQNPATT